MNHRLIPHEISAIHWILNCWLASSMGLVSLHNLVLCLKWWFLVLCTVWTKDFIHGSWHRLITLMKPLDVVANEPIFELIIYTTCGLWSSIIFKYKGAEIFIVGVPNYQWTCDSILSLLLLWWFYNNLAKCTFRFRTLLSKKTKWIFIWTLYLSIIRILNCSILWTYKNI